MKKLISVTIALALLLAMAVTTPVAAASTKINVSPGDNIQDTIDTASQGAVIIVGTGEYHQSVVFGPEDSGITLKGEEGAVLNGAGPADPGTTLTHRGITISTGANSIIVRGLEIVNFTQDNGGGIFSRGSEITIDSNTVSNCFSGIVLFSGNKVINNDISGITTADGIYLGGSLSNPSTGNLINNNRVSGSGNAGISLHRAQNNEVSNNEISGSFHVAGLALYYSSTNKVIGNEVTGTAHSGIYVMSSAGNLIKKNKVSGNTDGIHLYLANDNEVIGNEVSGSTSVGILSRLSTGNLIKENKVSDSNEWGIQLNSANDNQIIGNKVSGSAWFDIYVRGSSGNLIRKNKVSDSGLLGLYDDSAPPPLDNTWEKNKYETANF